MKTLHIGAFTARETIRICPTCSTIYRSHDLSRLVPPSCIFGYDILVAVGTALFVDHLADQKIVDQLAAQNISISASEIGYLGKKFIGYLTVAHRKSSARLTQAMASNGGYILHVDATYEKHSPLLMSGLDSIMHIVLGNCRLPSENSDDIIPFLHDLRDLFGEPLAVVHDLSPAIIKAVRTVFPDTLDFICHFHFLRDLGKDLLGADYATIRGKLRDAGVTQKLHHLVRVLIPVVKKHSDVIALLESTPLDTACRDALLEYLPAVATCSLLHWALEGLHQGQGYGFPFDRPYLALTRRVQRLSTELEFLRTTYFCQDARDKTPLHRLILGLTPLMNDTSLWDSVARLEADIRLFDQLRTILRIAPKTGKKGLNEEGRPAEMETIKAGVTAFKQTLIHAEGYSEHLRHQKMIAQIDKYWHKLFADPIQVETPNGTTTIHPQRTNNLAEQHFRDLKRGYRQKTGKGALGKTFRTMLANTPLVKNLHNAEYMKILLHGKSRLEDLFADIESSDVRHEMHTSHEHVEKIPVRLQKLTKQPTYPDVVRNCLTQLQSNGILL